MIETSLAYLLSTYRVLLIDAYGVLVTSSGALPGARDLIDHLNRSQTPYFILTNDASRLPASCATYYAQCGLEIPAAKVLTAGLAISEYLDQLPQKPARCLVLGSQDSRRYIENAGHIALPLSIYSILNDSFDAIVIADDSGFDFLSIMNALLTRIHRSILQNQLPTILLANADVIYPQGQDAFGFTSGAMAQMLQLGVTKLHPGVALDLKTVGKPGPALFKMALNRAKCLAAEAVMIGDQLHTDIKGAESAGIRSVLVESGVSNWSRTPSALSTNKGSDNVTDTVSDTVFDPKPTYILRSLATPAAQPLGQ